MLGVLIGVGVIGAVYSALCALLYFKQDQLLFYPVATDPRLAMQWESNRVAIETSEVVIEGWWSRNDGISNDLVILYFGGNAEDVLYAVATAKRLHARAFLATNYRGYGSTGGKPSGEYLFNDALAIYDYATSRPGVSPQNIVVMGRSLGSGVATFIASKRPVRAAVLVTPYDSMAAVAQGHYPYFPVSWLLKHRFPSAELAVDIRVPSLMIAAEHDDVIPLTHTRRLMEAWGGPKRLVTIPGVGHNDVDQANEYAASVNSFLDSLH
jgi:uncharacterized protein